MKQYGAPSDPAAVYSATIANTAEIHKEFQTQMLLLDDGRLLTELVFEETDDQLRILPNLLKPKTSETIDKSSIEKRQVADVSTMPTGLLDTF